MCLLMSSHDAFIFVPFTFAVITAFPALTPFTTPLELTDAIFFDDDDHTTVFCVASFGLIVAFNFNVFPFLQSHFF